MPPKQRATVILEIDNRSEYNKAETDVIKFVAQKAVEDAAFNRELEGLSPNRQRELRSRRYESAATRAANAEALVRISALTRLSVKGKMTGIKAWVRGFFSDSAEKLVLFAHHVDVQKELLEEFPGSAQILGGDTLDERQCNVDRFQSDADCRLCIASIKAGGVGITLTAASHVCFVELGWSPADHDQAEDRLHRIGQAESVTAWYLLGDGTIDIDIADLLNRKRSVIEVITEGGEAVDFEVFRELLDRLRRKRSVEPTQTTS